MKKIILVFVLCAVSAPAFAKKTTYIYTNNRFNFVKLEEMNKKEAEKIAPSHPFTFTVEQMRDILKEVKLSRSFITKKEVETQDVFDESAVNFLAPKLVDAFAKATGTDKVVFSYLTKDPKFILRDDRVTIASAWMKGTDLYIEFEKLLAKLTGDYDKRGDFSKIIARSRGLRLSLAVRDGQSYGNTTGELVVDTTHDFAKAAVLSSDAEGVEEGEKAVTAAAETGKAKPERELVRPASKSIKGPQFDKTRKIKQEEDAITADLPEGKSVEVTEVAQTRKERLKELKQLKADGLITDQEYKEKKREILKGL